MYSKKKIVMKFKKLTPNFMVNNVRESVKFYTENLGFKLDLLVPKGSKDIEKELEENKEYACAMVSRDEVFVMFIEKEAFRKDAYAPNSTEIGASALFYCEVDDLNRMYESVRNKVGISAEPHETWYGMREFYIKDPDGYVLVFAERK